jgi:hypothetical protein
MRKRHEKFRQGVHIGGRSHPSIASAGDFTGFLRVRKHMAPADLSADQRA